MSESNFTVECRQLEHELVELEGEWHVRITVEMVLLPDESLGFKVFDIPLSEVSAHGAA